MNVRQKALVRSRLLSTNEWTDEARKAALEARKRKSKIGGKKRSVLGAIGRGALIGGAGLLGGALGAKALSKMTNRGRALRAGEDLTGKVFYVQGEKGGFRPLWALGRNPSVKPISRFVNKNAGDKTLKGRIASAIEKVDEAVALPERHFGVGIGDGKVAHYKRLGGVKVEGSPEKFALSSYADPKNIRVVSEGTKDPKKLAERLAERKGWKGEDLKYLGHKNCEGLACGISKGKDISKTVSDLRKGSAGGATLGSAGAYMLTKDKRRTDNQLNRALQVINGGPGSGHHGHKGIPGQRGGSLPEGESVPSGRSNTRALTRAKTRLSPSPEAIQRRRKNVFTKSAKLADVYEQFANKLEKRRKKRLMPLSKRDTAALAEAHENAAMYFHVAGEQASMVKKMPTEEQVERLLKSEDHLKRANKLRKKLGRKPLTAQFLREAAATFKDELVGQAARETGRLAADVTKAGIRGSIKQVQREAKKTKTDVEYDDAKLRAEITDAENLASDKINITQKMRDDSGLKPSKVTTRRAGPIDYAKGSAKGFKKGATEQARQRVKEYMGQQDRDNVRRQALQMIAEAKGRHGSAIDDIHSMGSTVESANRIRKAQEEDSKPKKSASPVQPENFDKTFTEFAASNPDLADKYIRLLQQGMQTPQSGPDDEYTGNQSMETQTVNLAGQVRREQLHGKEYLVAPLTMIVPGVLAGSKGPLLYPEEEVRKNPSAWNGMPIVVNHPMKEGRPVEARSPDILEQYQIGTVFNSRYNGKLQAEGWFEVDRTRKTNIGIYENLVNNKPIELSTGLYTDNVPFKGTWNGRPYEYVAKNYRPDHLAILLGSRGACSIQDGCGVLINEDNKEQVLNVIRAKLAHPFREATKEAIKTTGKALGGYKKAGQHVASGLNTKSVKKAKDKVISSIRKKPVTATAIGTAAGYKLGQRSERKKQKKFISNAEVLENLNRALIVINEDGEWKTIKGRRVFIKKGQSPEEAFQEDVQKEEQDKGSWGKFAAGGALGAAGAGAGYAGGLAAGGALGAKLGALTGMVGGPVGAAIGGVVGGGAGMALGSYAARKAAKNLQLGKSGQRGALVGEIGAGGAGIAKSGLKMLGSKLFGLKFGTKAAQKGASALASAGQQATKADKVAEGITTAGKIRKGAVTGGKVVGGLAGDTAAYEGTRIGLESKFGNPDILKKRKPIHNAWTEEARQASIEARKAKARSKAEALKARQAKNREENIRAARSAGSIAGGLVAYQVVGPKLRKATETETIKKAGKSVKSKINKAFAKGGKTYIHDPVSGKNIPVNTKAGAGRKAIRKLKKVGPRSKSAARELRKLITRIAK